MLSLQNDQIALNISDDGSLVELVDRQRCCSWKLDAGHRQYRLYKAKGDPSPRPLPLGAAHRDGGRISITHAMDEGPIRYHWELKSDHVTVTLDTAVKEIEMIALPGAMVPSEGERQMALPLYQGLRFRRSGSEWLTTAWHGGHMGFSMAMGAGLSDRGGLLITHNSPSNWAPTFGEDADGPLFFFEQRHCPIDQWPDATVRLYPVDADVTAICKRYRQVVKERGELVLWQEKIAKKPILENLFGACMAFIGYNKTDQVDYVASAKKLKSYGFESIFFYPVRMCQYSLNFKMGGDEPIWLSDETISAMKAIPGVHVSPWTWVVEGLDDGSPRMHRIFRTGEDGKFIPAWKMDENQFQLVCLPYQIEHMQMRLASNMMTMDWLHFDVNAMRSGVYCFREDHSLHGHRPMSRREDMQWTRRLFSPETVGNRIVSSEGFADEYAPVYDIGSTKIMPPRSAQNRHCMPVPMTMLVFHDSVVHDWWELHNYNPVPSFVLSDASNGRGTVGSGQPRLKAAMDAMYGCPPNLFPFGKQYGWVNKETRETFSFLVRLEDAAVQQGIAAALSVAKLHKRIGKLEMISHEILSDDWRVQRSTFVDGTRIVANLSDQEREVEGCGPMPAQSWREVG